AGLRIPCPCSNSHRCSTMSWARLCGWRAQTGGRATSASTYPISAGRRRCSVGRPWSMSSRASARWSNGCAAIATFSVGSAVLEESAVQHETAHEDNLFSHDHLTVIEPPSGWHMLNWRELWAYRELLWVLTARDVKVRYKQTVLGAAWAIIRPVTT